MHGFRKGVLVALAAWVLLFAVARAAFYEKPQTMQETLQRGVTAFTQGDYETAADAFDYLEEKFGDEHQYKPLRDTLLPIRGYACQMANRWDEAIGHFETFLELPNTAVGRRQFVLFSLAQAYHQNGDTERAVETYQSFIEAAPDTPEAVLSALRQAELYFENGDDDEGIQRLVGFAASDRVPPSLGAQAQLRALQKALELEDHPKGREILFGYEWRVQGMPELAVLTYSALEIGNRLLDEGKAGEAIRAYRLVTPAAQLEAAQQACLAELQIAWQEKRARAGEGYHAEAVWDDYYRGVTRRVEAQLDALRESDDFTPGFQTRLGQAFLLGERPREAYLMFQALAEDEALDDALRASAHYRWILAANALENWDESLRIARSFLDRYPEHPEAPAALFLIANAYQEKMDYAQAVAVLTDLLEAYPRHRLAPRWRFSRGYNATLAQDYPPAREDFETVLREGAEGQLAASSRLWLAMTYFFDRAYPEALTRFDAALEATPKDNPVYPELVYRRAQTLYSDRRYDEALPEINAFLEQYADHLRTPEARVLKGDILMGQGELLPASNQFARVTPEAGALFPYAVFQRGKIQQALEAYDLMVEHFTNYVRREDVPDKTRVAEALYWIGWARQQQGRTTEAFPLFVEALVVHGNDPRAGETDGILQALHDLHRRYRAGEIDLATAGIGDADGLLVAPTFEDWLEDQRKEAIREQRWTWLSRLNLYRAKLYRKQKDPDRESVALLEVVEKVPLEDLDAEGLAQVGGLLAGMGFPSSRDYFDRLLEEHPRSPQVGAAYYGLAKLAALEGNHALAESWLVRFEAETPYHPAAADAKLLRGQTLVELGQTERAIEVLEELLRLKSARGRPHAQALLGIAEAWQRAGQSDKAIAYYQRVYTLYRAYPEQLLVAYLASAPLFEERGDLRAAYNTWAELRGNERLSRFEESWALAEQEMIRLEPLLPPEPEPEAVAVDASAEMAQPEEASL